MKIVIANFVFVIEMINSALVQCMLVDYLFINFYYDADNFSIIFLSIVRSYDISLLPKKLETGVKHLA